MVDPGKQVLDYLYIHLHALSLLTEDLRRAVNEALEQLPPNHPCYPNVAKLNLRTGALSLLDYPRFDEDAFPELKASWVFKGGSRAAPTLRRYDAVLNPPILHRKELLVPFSHPRRAEWAELTRTAESLGLFDDISTIGFRLNWERLIENKGYQLVDGEFLPLGNDVAGLDGHEETQEARISRHRTALSRTVMSAPVQLLMRHNLLATGGSFFDYGCGKGRDVALLRTQGYTATGWDPHYAPSESLCQADVVNLGFVVNVIEDPAERVEALQCAYALARDVLVVSAMLHSNDVSGTPYRDGVLTSRKTFQKYYSQGELKDFIEQVLHQPALMVAPGIGFIFANKELEQQFSAGRYRTRALAERLLRAPRLPRDTITTDRPPRMSRSQEQLLAARPLLDSLWVRAIDLGRWPDACEVENPEGLNNAVGGLAQAVRLLKRHYDMATLDSAARARRDDVLLYLVNLQFEKRRPYRQLAPRLQRDVKAFFGDYKNARHAAQELLLDASSHEKLLAACRYAQELGLGWLEEDHSLQLHVELVDRLPVLLRAYVACGLILWDSTSEVQLVKIHIGSGKLTLLAFDDFDESPLPRLRRRIKITLRNLEYEVFEYGSAEYPMPLLYWKSRYLHEDYTGYAEQLSFDEAFAKEGLYADSEFGPSAKRLSTLLEQRRLEVSGFRLAPSTRVPDLDAPCGKHFTFRAFIECSETQQRTAASNLPAAAATYNALYALAVQILDPVIEYFGSIKLTYGFCSSELAKHIRRRVAPKLDQHACHETDGRGRRICRREGAACDFLVEDEDMEEVAAWIAEHLPFDRMYIYGKSKPLHVSYGPEQSRAVFSMRETTTGALLPIRLRSWRAGVGVGP